MPWARRAYPSSCAKRPSGAERYSCDGDCAADCIRPSIGSRELFLRKAIGWVLRQYAKTDPETVERYMRENEAVLSGLSRREAMRQIERRRAR